MIPGIVASVSNLTAAIRRIVDLPLEGANGSSTFTDNTGRVWTGAGGVTISTDTRPEGALKLNGTTQYLNTVSDTSLQPTNKYCVWEANIRLTAYATAYFGTYQAVVFGKDQVGGREYLITVQGTVSSWTKLVFTGFASNVSFVTAEANFAFALNTDYLIKVIRDPVAGTVSISINGTVINTAAFGVLIQATATPLRIGANVSDAINFPGYIWGVGIYNSVNVQMFGDSITVGVGASVVANSYAKLLTAAKGWTYTNNAVSGDMIFDQAIPIFNNTLGDGDKSTLMIGTNDQRVYGVNPSRLAQFKRAHLAALVWLSIAESKKIRGVAAGVTKTGSWSTTPVYGGALGVSTTVVGDKVSFSFTGTTVYLAFIQQVGVVSTGDIRVDGVLVGSVSCAGPSINTANGVGYGPAMVRVGGLTNAAHTVEITVTAASGGNPFYFSWAGTPSADARVCVINIPRFTAGGYSTYGGSDANVADYNAAVLDNVSTLQADGLNIAYSNVAAAVNPTTDLVADGVHPNDTGHSKIALYATADF